MVKSFEILHGKSKKLSADSDADLRPDVRSVKSYSSVSPSILNAGRATLFGYRTSKKVGWVYGTN